MAFSISALLGLSQLTWSTSSAGGMSGGMSGGFSGGMSGGFSGGMSGGFSGWMSGGFSGAGRFSSSSNCSPISSTDLHHW